MAELLTDLQSVKLTVDQTGEVWILNGYQLPHSTKQRAAAFVAARSLPAETVLRVPGLSRNAELLLALYAAVKRGEFAKLEVCSPLCCATQEERNEPDVLLYNSRRFACPPSAGGWHEFDDDDLVAYRLAERYGKPDVDVAARQLDCLAHPAWPALMFPEGLDQSRLAELLGLIVDPRWFVDPGNPEQTNKLPQFLGLDPHSQSASKHDKAGRVTRNRLVMSCWKTAEPPQIQHLRPAQFLWKLWYAKGGGVRADLAVSKRFVEYLRLTWLSEVCRDGHKGRIFVPRFFFEDAETVAAYKEHMQE